MTFIPNTLQARFLCLIAYKIDKQSNIYYLIIIDDFKQEFVNFTISEQPTLERVIDLFQ